MAYPKNFLSSRTFLGPQVRCPARIPSIGFGRDRFHLVRISQPSLQNSAIENHVAVEQSEMVKRGRTFGVQAFLEFAQTLAPRQLREPVARGDYFGRSQRATRLTAGTGSGDGMDQTGRRIEFDTV
jgi:hypothetical protein